MKRMKTGEAVSRRNKYQSIVINNKGGYCWKWLILRKMNNQIKYNETFPKIYEISSNSIGMRRYQTFCQDDPTKVQSGPIWIPYLWRNLYSNYPDQMGEYDIWLEILFWDLSNDIWHTF